jgi:hypothetical protein
MKCQTYGKNVEKCRQKLLKKKRPLWKQGPKPKLTAYEKNLNAFLYNHWTTESIKNIHRDC